MRGLITGSIGFANSVRIPAASRAAAISPGRTGLLLPLSDAGICRKIFVIFCLELTDLGCALASALIAAYTRKPLTVYRINLSDVRTGVVGRHRLASCAVMGFDCDVTRRR